MQFSNYDPQMGEMFIYGESTLSAICINFSIKVDDIFLVTYLYLCTYGQEKWVKLEK